jgi:hypothetical protein
MTIGNEWRLVLKMLASLGSINQAALVVADLATLTKIFHKKETGTK